MSQDTIVAADTADTQTDAVAAMQRWLDGHENLRQSDAYIRVQDRVEAATRAGSP